MHSEIRDRLLNVLEKGIELYEDFKKERIFEKSKSLSASITKNNLPDFKSVPSIVQSKVKKAKISTSETQRIIALATERNYPLEELLKYDLTYKIYYLRMTDFSKRKTIKVL